jgi:hypothetical protein
VPRGQGEGGDVDAKAPVAEGQKKPAGQPACVVLAVLGDGQKKPCVHGFAVLVKLPAARQNPAPHAAQEVSAVNDVPPPENVPAGQGVATAEPAGQ